MVSPQPMNAFLTSGLNYPTEPEQDISPTSIGSIRVDHKERRDRDSCATAKDVKECDTTLGSYKDVSLAVKKGRSVASTLHYALLKRIQAEERYAKELSAIAKCIQISDDDKCSTSDVVQGYAKYLNHIATSHSEFAKDLTEDVVGSLAQVVSNHRHVWNSIEKDYQDLETKKGSLASSAVIVNNDLAKESDEMKTQLAVCLSAHPCLQLHEYKSKMTHFLESTRTVNDIENRLRQKHEQRVTFEENVVTQRTHIMRSLVDMDNKRVACCKDNLRKCVMFDLAMLRNVIYEAEHLTDPIETIESHLSTLTSTEPETTVNSEEPSNWINATAIPVKQLTSADDTGIASFVTDIVSNGNIEAAKLRPLMGPFIRDVSTMFSGITGNLTARKSSSESQEVVENPLSGGFDDSTGVPDTVLIQDIDRVFEDIAKGITPKLSVETESHVNRYVSILSSVFNGDTNMLTLENGESLKDDLSSSVFRGILLEALARILDETDGKLPSMLALRVISKVVVWGLDWADSQNDTAFGQWIVCNATRLQTNGFEDDDPQQKKWHWPKTDVQRSRLKAKSDAHALKLTHKDHASSVIVWTMQQAIYTHRLLNRVAFWESAFIGLLGNYQVWNYLQQWWNSQPTTYPEAVTERYRALYELNVAPCFRYGLKHFPTIMQSYGIVDVQIEHMIMKLTVKYGISSELLQDMYEGFVRNPDQIISPEESSAKDDELVMENIVPNEELESKCFQDTLEDAPLV